MHKKQNALWSGLAIAILLGIIWQFIPLDDAKNRISSLPLSGLDYKGQDLPLKPFEKDFLKGVNVIKRMYTLDGQNFFITIIDGTRNRHVIHDPYYCFKGSGWSIVSTKEIAIKKGHAKQVLISKKGQEQEALFWFTNGDSQYTSPLKYWTQTTLRRLTLGLSGPEPILIVIQPKQIEKVNWGKFFDSFQVLLMI